VGSAHVSRASAAHQGPLKLMGSGCPLGPGLQGDGARGTAALPPVPAFDFP